MRTEPADRAAPLPLEFDRWAELSARLLDRTGEERVDILDEQGIDPADMERCDTQYGMEIAREVAQGRMERAESYARKCAAELAGRTRPPVAEASAEAAAEAEEEAEPAALELTLEPDPEPSAPPTFMQAPSGQRLAGTMDAFEIPTAYRNAALPFKEGASSLFAAPSEPPQPRPATGGAALAQTMDVGSALLKLAPATPFAPSSRPPAVAFPRMPLETYASLCAELAVFPQKAAEVLAKYHVPPGAAHAAVDEEWQARFVKFPETKAKWQDLVKQYREWLERQPR